MTKFFTALAAFLLSAQLLTAQTPIPNGSFENWAQGNPVGWGSSDKVLTQLFQPDPGGVERDTVPANVYAGNSSVRITSKTVSIPGIGTQTIPGVVSLGNLAFSIATFMPVVTGLAYTDRPDSISFAAKFTKAIGSNDTGAVVVTLTKWMGTDRVVVANSIIRVVDNPTFQLFDTKLEYHSVLAPDTLLIQGLSGLSQVVAEDSKMWLDTLRFHGLDTAFKAYVFPFFDRNICEGDTVSFRTDSLAGDTYQWYNNDTAINGATNSSYIATTSGNYSVQVVHSSSTYTSDTIAVVVNANPAVSFALSLDSICNNAATVTLSGGSPAGGQYLGDGINNGVFDPADAGAGTHTITYRYTESNGCSAEATQSVVVKACATGIQILEPGLSLNIFPNPASNFVRFETNEKLNGGSIQIFDAQGKLLIAERITDAATSINIESLAAGTYTVQMINAANKAVAVAKVSVSRQF